MIQLQQLALHKSYDTLPLRFPKHTYNSPNQPEVSAVLTYCFLACKHVETENEFTVGGGCCYLWAATKILTCGYAVSFHRKHTLGNYTVYQCLNMTHYSAYLVQQNNSCGPSAIKLQLYVLQLSAQAQCWRLVQHSLMEIVIIPTCLNHNPRNWLFAHQLLWSCKSHQSNEDSLIRVGMLIN